MQCDPIFFKTDGISHNSLLQIIFFLLEPEGLRSLPVPFNQAAGRCLQVFSDLNVVDRQVIPEK